jgi:integrase
MAKTIRCLSNLLQLDGVDVKERTNNLYDLVKTEGSEWLESHLVDFIYYQKQRVEKKEITETTINNYIKPLKTFCDMNNFLGINWKHIRKGVPKGRKSAIDRIPEITEIKKLLNAPDIRLKPIVLTMLSSGVRLGVWEELKWKHITPIYNEENKVLLLPKFWFIPVTRKNIIVSLRRRPIIPYYHGCNFGNHMVKKYQVKVG